MPGAEPPQGRPSRDLADEAMLARAHERFAGERRRGRRAATRGALPNLVLIGGLKCGTTSLHHYLNLHPQVAMSRPKELNFFVAELNWDLGADWYASHFDPGADVRGETSPHYTNRPRLEGVARRMRELLDDVRILYAVRDPIERLLSHYVHNVGGGYESRPLEQVLGDESQRLRRPRALRLPARAVPGGVWPRRDRDRRTGRSARRSPGDHEHAIPVPGRGRHFSSPEFDREWETGAAKGSGGFQLMDRAVRLPGLRALDRNFDRLPESLRWRVERTVHPPGWATDPKPKLPAELRALLADVLAPDVTALESLAGRSFGWELRDDLGI